MLLLDLRSCCPVRSQNRSAYQPLVNPAPTSPTSWKCCPKTILCVISVGAFILWLNLESTMFPEITDFNVPKIPNLKFILMWTPNDYHPFYLWKSGQDIFFESKCPISNCYVTNQRHFFGGDVTKFDAIVFNGRNLQSWDPYDLPKKRSPHQKYIFINMESSDNQPICDPIFDRFFNWTATYKLNSDVLFSYLLVLNSADEDVGPRNNMTWTDPMSAVNESFQRTVKNKTKAAAWFVSHCSTRSKREDYAHHLKKVLKEYNLTLDIYGDCGKLKCARNTAQFMCDDMLRDKYFFYLSFENSFAEDYITEKVLTALQNSVVPIVYSGANYSRFLPPGSYLDARLYNPAQLARLMVDIISSPATYYDYFRWRNHYTYHYPKGICRLCAALNNNSMLNTHTVYDHFRSWWNPNYKVQCLEDVFTLTWFESINQKILEFLKL